MSMQDHIQLWDQVQVRVLDVRFMSFQKSEQMRRYVLPTSTFVFISGRGQLWLNHEVWSSSRFLLLHGGKGRYLTIEATEPIEVYFIFYKATLPSNVLREYHMMLLNSNPFEQNWAEEPVHPLELRELSQHIHRCWNEQDHLGKLQIKGYFFHLVQLVTRQRSERQGGEQLPSLTEQVLRYISGHFREQLSLDTLAESLNYSPQYLSRKFKEQTGVTPTEYIIQMRMNEAQNLLVSTEATLNEIATYVGYPDPFYFNRAFKKEMGTTPGKFRIEHRKRMNRVSKNTINETNESIVSKETERYPLVDDDNHYQFNGDEETEMFNNLKAALMSLVLIFTLSACGTATQSAVSTDAAAEEAEQPAVVEMKTVKTAFGDVEIPAHPQRVAAIDYLGTVLALGVKPVGGGQFLMNSPYLEGHLDGIEVIGDSVEQLMELQPDFIITLNPDKAAYEKYSQIAPTVSIASITFPALKDEVSYFGEVLGKEAEAQEWLANFDQEIAQIKQKVNDVVPADTTFSVMQEYDRQVFIFGNQSGRGGRNIYELLGLQAPEVIPAELMEGAYHEFSIELLSKYAGDYLILTSKAQLKELQADPVWGSLPAVQNGRVYLWTEEESWFRDPIALLKQTQDLAEWIIDLNSK
ncbi:AraC family transcriptional regulator [Paenibacillus sp. MER 99-2]|uniref:AraC family transcriptional regulator n=1 Tax=Paenibacillus sp. MER 99-2 TaxID=2939572 RepID=UPI00203AF983|nr:AraC family transcriptional regulator [Paenibacillus sp. MER 99-2]MCM3172640.1 AraC family transcriptional regulator [Paenibacillus sp. MER 99-2]